MKDRLIASAGFAAPVAGMLGLICLAIAGGRLGAALNVTATAFWTFFAIVWLLSTPRVR